jgi:poly(hydroxyalkanoate) granule-associated protein
MARKTASQSQPERTAEALGQSVAESAQKIWLAGLGAFSRVRNEGDGLFNTLVEQGKGMRERARGAADQAMKNVRTQADATLTEAQSQWGRLEQVFEERLSRSLNRLGVMTREEIDDLSRQVQELNASVQALVKAQSASPRSSAPPRGAAKKAPRKRAAAKAVRKAKR